MNPRKMTRRQMLGRTAGFGCACAGFSLLQQLLPTLASPSPDLHPLRARSPHFAPKAKRAIMFFLTGGLSHMDSFDPKPELAARVDQELRKGKHFLGSPWPARPRGVSGIEVSDLFPHLAGMVDDLAVIRSMRGDHNDHFEATLHMHTGSNGSAMPTLGAWLSHGLGTENTNLPSHIVFAEHKPYAGAQVWDSNFLPAYHQGVRIRPGDEPISHLRPHQDNPPELQDKELALLRRVNERHYGSRRESELAARMLSFETAANLQHIAPELFDLRNESDKTLELYGVQRGDNKSFGWQTLVARRMAEAGVRFIELIDTGASSNWDAHSNILSHQRLAKKIDRPIAAFLQDLKQRGLFDDTLVIFSTEFGRTADGSNNGRDHHCRSFTCWLAGAGVKPGHVHGGTDEIGMAITHDPVHVHDFHATILHLLGLNHERLTYHHAGRDFRLTDVHGRVVSEILS